MDNISRTVQALKIISRMLENSLMPEWLAEAIYYTHEEYGSCSISLVFIEGDLCYEFTKHGNEPTLIEQESIPVEAIIGLYDSTVARGDGTFRKPCKKLWNNFLCVNNLCFTGKLT